MVSEFQIVAILWKISLSVEFYEFAHRFADGPNAKQFIAHE